MVLAGRHLAFVALAGVLHLRNPHAVSIRAPPADGHAGVAHIVGRVQRNRQNFLLEQPQEHFEVVAVPA